MFSVFGDCHRILSRTVLLERTLLPKFVTSLLMKGALRWMPTITSISFWTLARLEGAARQLVFFS